MKIAVIVLGYVVLSLALQFARSSVAVCGIDIDERKIVAFIPVRSTLSIFQRNRLRASQCAVIYGDIRFYRHLNFECGDHLRADAPEHESDPDVFFILETTSGVASHLPKSILMTLAIST